MKVLLGSDLCRHLLRERDERLLAVLEERSAAGDELMLSAITYAELVAGALHTANREKHMRLVQAFCERLDDIAPWDREAVDAYTGIQMRAVNSGSVMNMNDAMLAAHALSLRAQLLCLKSGSFQGLEGLRVESVPEP